jgi:opacity protein-like surface antigen
MKNVLRPVLAVLLVVQSFALCAQIHYEKGYFVSNDGSKTQCLIKNEDWYKNPTEFKYKLLIDNNIQIGKIADIKEFGIDAQSKYIRADVNVDVSPSTLSDLSESRNPVWEKNLVFLKVLVEGKATLYSYKGKGLERFFYKTDDLGIEQLIYKEYFKSDHTTAVNDTFKIQLIHNVVCESSKVSTDEYPDYYEKDLVKYFIRYNQCSDPSFKVVESTVIRDILDVSLFAGINSSSLSINNETASYLSADFKSTQTVRIGAGIEYVLPFAKNQWSLLMESEFNQSKSNYQTDAGKRTIDYKALSISLVAKYYFFLNDDWKIFVKGGIHSIYADNFNSHYFIQPSYSTSEYNFAVTERPNILMGVGAEYRRFFAEFEYFTNQDVMSNSASFSTNLSRLSISVGYKIFKLRSKGK